MTTLSPRFSVPCAVAPLMERIDTFVIKSADVVTIVGENREAQLFKAKLKQLVVIHNSPPRQKSVSLIRAIRVSGSSMWGS